MQARLAPHADPDETLDLVGILPLTHTLGDGQRSGLLRGLEQAGNQGELPGAYAARGILHELATNALLHGSLRDRLIRVRIVVTGSVLRIEVSDPRGERLPSPRPAGEDDQFGRGLLLVAALADRWGLAPRAVGKTVYAEWDLVGRALLLVDAKQ